MPARRFPALLLAVLVLCSMAPAVAAGGPVGTTVEGTLELEISEQLADGHLKATYHYAIRDGRGQRTPVTFKGEPPAGFEPGAKVRVNGERTAKGLAANGKLAVLADAGSDAAAAAAEGDVATSGAAASGAATAAATTTVTKKLAVLLVNFTSNKVEPYTVAYAKGVIFTNSNSVAAFYTEDSYGKLALTGDVFGWFTVSVDTSTCDTAGIQTKADAAATAAGVVLSGYTNVSYVFPHLNACSFAGRAQLPGSRSWINTISTTTPKIHDWVVAHELGHNFGVNHANSYNCTTNGLRVTVSKSGADCASTEYGDPHTVMGAWNPIARYPHNVAWHRVQLGFIPPAERRDVTKSGLYTLGSTAFDESAPKAIRINRAGSTAIRHWFEIEFRQPDTLFDGFASTAPVVNGASFRLVADDVERRQSFLLDMTPSTGTFNDAALAVGKTFTDPLSGLAITTAGIVTDAAGHPALRLKILFPNTPPPAAPPNFTATSSRDGLTATLTWNAATSTVGVASYRIYRDGILVGTVDRTVTTFTDPDRVPGDTHTYRVEAIDWVDLQGAPATAEVLMLIPELGTTTASFAGLLPAATRAATVNLGLHFSAPVDFLTKASLTLSGTAKGCAITGLTGADADYNVAVTGCSEGTVAVSIAAGAVWDNAGYLAPAEDASSAPILIDRTAPVTKGPSTQLREGSSLSGSSVPVRIALAASDGSSGLTSFDVARSVDGGAYATLLASTTSTTITTGLPMGHSYRFRVRSRDAAGNVSAWVEGPILRPGLTEQTSTAITYRGTWSTVTGIKYSGSSVRYTRSYAAYASYTVTGRGIGFVTTTAPDRGLVKVYVDGVHVRTVDLSSPTATYRVLAFTRMFSSAGTHTIKLVGLATAGRPRVDLDAVVVIR